LRQPISVEQLRSSSSCRFKKWRKRLLSPSVGTLNFMTRLFLLTETVAIKIKRGRRSEKLFVVLYFEPTAGICVSWQRRSGKVSETRIKERRRERAARSAVGVQLSPLKSGCTLRSCRSSNHLLFRPRRVWCEHTFFDARRDCCVRRVDNFFAASGVNAPLGFKMRDWENYDCLSVALDMVTEFLQFEMQKKTCCLVSNTGLLLYPL